MMDEGMAALQSMFPEVEQAVLEAVLRGVGGDAIAAVDALLAMTDEERLRGALPPSAESEPFGGDRPPADSVPIDSGSAALAAQVAEDAELARQLQQQMLFRTISVRLRVVVVVEGLLKLGLPFFVLHRAAASGRPDPARARGVKRA